MNETHVSGLEKGSFYFGWTGRVSLFVSNILVIHTKGGTHAQYNQRYTGGSCGTLNYGSLSRKEGFRCSKKEENNGPNWQFNLE